MTNIRVHFAKVILRKSGKEGPGSRRPHFAHKALTPVSMLYPIDLSNMFDLVENCGRSDVQCFERIDGNTKQRNEG